MSDQQVSVSVIIVPDEYAAAVRDFAAQLAEQQGSEVEGFSAGAPNFGSFGSILGRPDTVRPSGNMFSGSGCTITKAFHADDVSCTDED